MNDGSHGSLTVGIMDDGQLEFMTDNRAWFTPDEARSCAAEIVRLADLADDALAP